jgi:uncharacterized membrane protein YcaP (DUF421 family)
MWNDMLTLDISVPDKIVRTVAVYLLLAVLLRLAGKRDLAQLNSFDLVVMLLLTNVVQNAVIGPDNSLTGGVIGAVVLIAFNAVLVRLAVRSERLRWLLEGSTTVLAQGGQWDPAALQRLGLREPDVDAALRRQNANDVRDTTEVTIEPGGAVVATLLPEQRSATAADVVRLEAKLDALLRAETATP